MSYTYDTWGKLLSTTGSLAGTLGVKNPYRYRGYRYDTETGLYYLQSRYYNPDWGRFVNADAYGGKGGTLLSHNMFAYALNNPINMDDPSGHWPKIIEAISTIVSGGLMIATGLAGATAITLGGALIATAFLIVGIGTVAVGIAKTAAIAQGAKDAYVDKINIQRNVINTFAGEKRGEVISAGVDIAMAGLTVGLGNKIVTQAPKTSLNSAKVVVKSVAATLKKPSTYIKGWSNYTTMRSVIEGMNKFNLMRKETYNMLIPIFDPSF